MRNAELRENAKSAPLKKLQEYSSFQNLLLQLEENIDQRAYGLIISDDTSGRIPALILHGAVNEIYLARGERPIPFIGLQGSAQQEHTAFIKNKYKTKSNRFLIKEKQKALIVTESVGTGEHLSRFREALEPQGVIFDVATLRANNSNETYHEKGILLDSQILYQGNAQDQRFSDNNRISGLSSRKYDHEKFLGVKNGKVINQEKRTSARNALIHARQTALLLAQDYLEVE